MYINDGGGTMLIGDLTPNDGVDCPVVAFNGNTPDVAWAAVQADPNCFAFKELIPGGLHLDLVLMLKIYVLIGYDGEFANGGI